mmetsp:Transcript_41959/g.75323  ORF Transcript_41959/g.75323 Transcript_41959/m.75323 type:complete len:230 (-) Transcript_41959:1328-2017(-)
MLTSSGTNCAANSESPNSKISLPSMCCPKTRPDLSPSSRLCKNRKVCVIPTVVSQLPCRSRAGCHASCVSCAHNLNHLPCTLTPPTRVLRVTYEQRLTQRAVLALRRDIAFTAARTPKPSYPSVASWCQKSKLTIQTASSSRNLHPHNIGNAVKSLPSYLQRQLNIIAQTHPISSAFHVIDHKNTRLCFAIRVHRVDRETREWEKARRNTIAQRRQKRVRSGQGRQRFH